MNLNDIHRWISLSRRTYSKSSLLMIRLFGSTLSAHFTPSTLRLARKTFPKLPPPILFRSSKSWSPTVPGSIGLFHCLIKWFRCDTSSRSYSQFEETLFNMPVRRRNFSDDFHRTEVIFSLFSGHTAYWIFCRRASCAVLCTRALTEIEKRRSCNRSSGLLRPPRFLDSESSSSDSETR